MYSRIPYAVFRCAHKLKKECNKKQKIDHLRPHTCLTADGVAPPT